MNLFDLMATLGLDSSAYEKGLDSAEGRANGFGSKLKSSLATAAKVGAAALGAATTAAVGFGVKSVQVGMDFDEAMSQVAATSGVTMGELEQTIGSVDTAFGTFTGNLRDYAQFMGSNTAFSATEAAEALNYMALAGYDAQTSMNMLPNVLSLAAAGGFELARASDMITDAQSALGLELPETSALVDQMAKTASKSNTSVEQLGDAILTIGGTAQFMAGGTDRLNTVLGILADNGIKGSEAGTHLRNMLLKLSSPSKEGAEVIEALNLQIFDAEGNMRDMQDIVQDLGVAMADMTDEQKVQAISALFNSRDVAAVQALLGTTTERWNELGDAIVDSTGSAQQMADVQLDNLAGDVTLFKSALEGARIAVSDELTPSIRDFVNFGSGAISKLTSALKEDGLNGVMSALGTIISEGIALIIDKMPEAIRLGLTLLQALITGIIDNLPQLADAAIQIISMIGSTMIENGPTLIVSLGEVLGQIIQKITDPETLSGFIQGVVTLITVMADTFIENIPNIISAMITILDNLIQVIQENLPIVIQAAIDIMNALIDGLIEALPTLIAYVPTLIDTIASVLEENLPTIINAGFDLIEKLAQGLSSNLPAIIDSIAMLIGRLIEFILQNLPEFMRRGMDIVMSIINGILDNLPSIISTIGQLIATIIVAIIQNLPQIFMEGGDILMELVMGLIAAIPQLIAAIPQIIMAIVKAFANMDWSSVGHNIIDGIRNGIMNSIQNLINTARDMAQRVISGIKGIFGIHSPSTLFRDQVGKMLGAGLAEGIEDSTDEAVKSAAEMAGDVIDTMSGLDAQMGASVSGLGSYAGIGGNGLTTSGAGITINVYGAEGQNVNELAEVISQKLAFATQQERLAWA